MFRRLVSRLRRLWLHFWMRLAGVSYCRRFATRVAMLCGPIYFDRLYLAELNDRGFISPKATLRGRMRLGSHVFIDDGVMIYQDGNGEPVVVGDRVNLHDNVCIQTGEGGTISIGPHTHIQRHCQIEAYFAPIHIGAGVAIAPRCAFYSFDHGMLPGTPISSQPLQSKGPIMIEDEVWLGYGVIVLSGVRIGRGAVIGAGSVVTRDVPDGAVAVGVPARIVKTRAALIGSAT